VEVRKKGKTGRQENALKTYPGRPVLFFEA
jgi:hypothetical protein